MVNHPRHGVILWTLVSVIFAITASDADACWWRHHCQCHSGSGRSSALAASPAASPSAAAGEVMAVPAYVAYAPVGFAPMQAAPSPSAGLGDVIEILKILPQIRDAFGSRNGDSTGSSGSSSSSNADLTAIRATLAELKEGQADLRGRLINNAGISQAIGEQLVKTDARVQVLQGVSGANGVLVQELAQINKTLNDRLPTADAAPETAEASKPAWFQAFEKSLEKRFDEIEKRLPAKEGT